MSDVEVTVLHDGEACRVSITGEFDLTACPTLHEYLSAAGGQVVIDCSGLTFADSTAIASFVMLAQRAASVTLERPTPTLWRALEVLGLTDMLPVTDKSPEPHPRDGDNVGHVRGHR